MNLYLVKMYSHRLNEWARYLVTAKDEAAANEQCDLGRDFRVTSTEFICVSDREVNTHA